MVFKSLWKCRLIKLANFYKKITPLISSITAPSINVIKKGNVPLHVAIIMDGNGRWAQIRNLPRMFGHKRGAEILHEIVIACKDIGIKYLTAFSFSTENWLRPKEEVDGLMSLFVEVLKKELPGLIENNVKLNLIGDKKTIPNSILEVFCDAEEKTKNNSLLILNLAFNYGSRFEIFQAAKKMCQKYYNKFLSNEEIEDISDFNVFSQFLYTKDIPDPDLLIRTSGEFRISNFLLWQIAYTELYFTDILWPDFTRKHFYKAIYSYQKRERRFGRI